MSPGEDEGLRGAIGGGREGLGGRDPLADREGESIPLTCPFGGDGRSEASLTDGDASLLLHRELDMSHDIRQTIHKQGFEVWLGRLR